MFRITETLSARKNWGVIMDFLAAGALIYAVAATAFLYNHFSQLFEAQMKVTDKILDFHMKSKGLKPTSVEDENEMPSSMDWLYDGIADMEEE